MPDIKCISESKDIIHLHVDSSGDFFLTLQPCPETSFDYVAVFTPEQALVLGRAIIQISEFAYDRMFEND